ncbi:hypothetical protein L596_029698 [Steinernema carpocapsae]|uniref:C2H2-type domain-containing protein n=1 Tax=Steinernema carpocapsae TaxID=34508 RepID=A0A4U5LQJ4_STECR|nr:hypothetical protein L596_029698 [Steinernema carpocapsae]
MRPVFGSFLCPLCGKTYKYEYNLFYHWRRNCRDLNELMPLDERKTMDVNALRELVDEVAQKKAEIGPIDIGISRNVLFSGGNHMKLDIPLTNNVGPKRGSTCKICGVYVLSAHFPRHAAAHRGEAVVDDRSPCGGYFCDLCGLLFRHHFNLFKHWRTSCQEIQANLPEEVELTMDDDSIRRMVSDLVKRVAVTSQENDQSEVNFDPHNHNHGYTHVHKSEEAMTVEPVIRKPVENRSQMSSHSHFPSVQEDFFDEADDQVVYADDYMDDFEGVMSGGGGDDGGVLTSLNGMSASTAYQRNKWSVNGGPVQCPECFRSFANSGRLERHLAGFHSAYGSHHCILCGNRFKYDYNLLYHYRRSCPYTKAFIDRDVREQMDATGLRKLVRNLASRDIRLNPHTVPPARMHHKRETGDALIRKQMMKYPTPSQLPPAHLMAPRPGLSDGRQCPVCAIFFYGNGVLERHMKAAHSQDYDVWEREQNRNTAEASAEEEQQQMEEGEEPQPEFPDTDEPPPTLTAEQPSEQPIDTAEPEEEHMDTEPISLSMPSRPRSSGRRPTHHIVNEHGMSIAQIHDISEVQQLIDSGQLQVQDGDQIILMQDNELEEYEGETEHYFETEDPRDRASGSYVQDSGNTIYVNSAGSLQQVDESGLEVAEILTEMKHDPSGHHSQEDVVYLTQEDGTIMVDEYGNPIVEPFEPRSKKPNLILNR